MSWVEKHMTKKVQLHLFLTIGLLACVTALLSSARPLGAAPDAFGLTVNVNPAGKGSVNVNPPPPYSNEPGRRLRHEEEV